MGVYNGEPIVMVNVHTDLTRIFYTLKYECKVLLCDSFIGHARQNAIRIGRKYFHLLGNSVHFNQ